MIKVGDKVWHPWCQTGVGEVVEIRLVPSGPMATVRMPPEAIEPLRGVLHWFGVEHLVLVQ